MITIHSVRPSWPGRLSCRGLLALVFLAHVPEATAQEAAPSVDLGEEADLRFRAGIDAYRGGRFDEALEHLLLSNRLVPNRNVVFNIARAYEQLGNFDAAFRHYYDYVAIETDAERRSAGERAIDRIRDKVALVQVESDPPGARVYVDRVDLGARGTTPVILALPAGSHDLILQLKDHVQGVGSATLVVGGQASVEVSLEPILGTVRVAGNPAGAEIRHNTAAGPLLGVLPGNVALPPGPQVVVVSSPGYRSVTQLVQVEPKAEVTMAVELELITGTLVVNALDRGALVEIDGEPAGFTPAVLQVPIGAHELRVTLPGHHDFVQAIDVQADQSLTVEARLRSLREVVAATRTAQGVDEVPASVSLISAQEIRAFGYQSVYQALSNVRGVFPSNDLTYAAVGFRGFATPGDYGNRVLVTVDGHTMNDDQLGASYVSSDFTSDLEDVQQIEVVRGPGSALYGSNAFFGVVNVVTHDGRSVPRPHVRVSADGESSLRARAGSGFGDDERGGWLSASGVTAQGRDYVFDEYRGTPRGNATGASSGADAALARTLHGRVWLGDLEVQAFHHGREKEIPSGAFGTRLADPRTVAKDYRSFGEVRYTPALGDKADLTARAWLDAYSYQGQFPYGFNYVYVDTWDGMWVGAEPRLVARPTDFLNVTVGAEMRQYFLANLVSQEYANVDTGDLLTQEPVQDDNPTSAMYSGYGILELIGGEVIRVSAGGRVDAFDTADLIDEDVVTFNPRLGVILTPTDTDVFKLMGGTAFREPSPYEYLYDDGGLTQVPPESLIPERILTGELEYTHNFDDITSLTAAVYHNRIQSLVQTEDLPDGTFRYANTGDLVQTVGGEAELRREWRQGWMASIQHAAQQTRVGDLLGDDLLVNSPPHIFGLKGAVPLVNEATLATALRSESPRPDRDGDFTRWAHLVDVTVTGDVPRLGVEWGLGVRNLLDWRQDHPVGSDLRMPTVPQPTRTGFASVRVGF